MGRGKKGGGLSVGGIPIIITQRPGSFSTFSGIRSDSDLDLGGGIQLFFSLGRGRNDDGQG